MRSYTAKFLFIATVLGVLAASLTASSASAAFDDQATATATGPQVDVITPQPGQTITTPLFEVTGQLPEGYFIPWRTLIIVLTYDQADFNEVISGRPDDYGASYGYPDETGFFDVDKFVTNDHNEMLVYVRGPGGNYYKRIPINTDIPDPEPDPEPVEPVRGRNYQPAMFDIRTPAPGDGVDEGAVEVVGAMVPEQFGDQVPVGVVYAQPWKAVDADPDTDYSAGVDWLTPSELDENGEFSVTVEMAQGHDEILVYFYGGESEASAEWYYTAIPVTVDAADPGVRQYAALGDSYSSGEGLSPYLPGRLGVMDHRDCHRSERSWPAKVVLPDSGLAAINDLEMNSTFKFPACAGAVIKNFWWEKQQTPYPHTDESSPVVPLQFQELSTETDLVTWTIGGNDAGFSKVIQFCFLVSDCFDRPFARTTTGGIVTLSEWLDVKVDQITEQYIAMYEEAVYLTDGNATIVVAGYPHLVALLPRRVSVDCALLDHLERRDMTLAVDQLNAAAAFAAETAGIEYVSVLDAFGEGSGVCGHANADQEKVSGVQFADSAKQVVKLLGPCSFNTVNPLLIIAKRCINPDPGNPPLDPGSFHPKESGTEAYAQAVSERLAELAADAVEQDLPVNDLGLPVVRGQRFTRPTGASAASAASASMHTEDRVAAAASYSDADLAAIQNYRHDSLDYGYVAEGFDSCHGAVTPGQKIIFRGQGFAPGSDVTVTWQDASMDTPTGNSPTIEADDTGTVIAGFQIPATTAAAGGVTLVGVQDDGVGQSLIAPFGIAAPGTECADLARATGQMTLPADVEFPVIGGDSDSPPPGDGDGPGDTPGDDPAEPSGAEDAEGAQGSGSPAASNNTGGPLAATGTEAMPLVMLGLALIATGAVFVRRSKTASVSGGAHLK